MKIQLKQTASPLTALALMCGLVYVLFRIVGLFRGAFSQINPTVAAGFVAAAATAIVSPIFVLASKRLERKAELLKEHREKKTPLSPSNVPFQILFDVEEILLAIRRDLGHSNKNVKRAKSLDSLSMVFMNT